jgi:exonuclease SbcC
VRQAKSIVEAAEARATRARWVAVGLLLAAIAVATGVTWLLNRMITGTLSRASEQAQALADGLPALEQHTADREQQRQQLAKAIEAAATAIAPARVDDQLRRSDHPLPTTPTSPWEQPEVPAQQWQP